MAASDRRLFLAQTLKLGAFTFAANSLPMLSETVSPQSNPLARMQWMNEPRSSRIEGDRLTVHSSAKADFYRLPNWTVDNGNFFHLPVAGDFAFEARINARFITRYDQAGLMVRMDAENWVKCGIEFVDGVRNASVVFTRRFSDWSTMNDLSQTAPVWWRVVRKRDSIQTLCSLDGKDFKFVREGYFAPSPKLEVGILCASTEGQGIEGVFDSVKLSAV